MFAYGGERRQRDRERGPGWHEGQTGREERERDWSWHVCSAQHAHSLSPYHHLKLIIIALENSILKYQPFRYEMRDMSCEVFSPQGRVVSIAHTRRPEDREGHKQKWTERSNSKQTGTIKEKWFVFLISMKPQTTNCSEHWFDVPWGGGTHTHTHILDIDTEGPRGTHCPWERTSRPLGVVPVINICTPCHSRHVS